MKNKKTGIFVIIYLIILNVININFVVIFAKNLSNDDYLMLDKKMEESKAEKAKVEEKKKQYIIEERNKITEEEKENLRKRTLIQEDGSNERLKFLKNIEEKNKEQLEKYKEEQQKIIEGEKNKEENLIKEKNKLSLEQKQMMAEKEKIENERKQIEQDKKNANKQKQISMASREEDEERQRQLKIREENLKMQQEKIKFDQERLRLIEEKNKKELEEKLKKQEEIFKKQEEKNRREQEIKERKLKEEEAITKARKEEIVIMQKKMEQQNEELKKILLANNVELKNELEKQRKDRETIEREIKELKNEQTNNFNKLKIINREGNVKTSNEQVNSKTIDIINKAENNLNYIVRKKNREKEVNIEKGTWAKNDLIEEKVIDFKIKKTSKKIEGMENEIDVNNSKIKSLKDLAYEAVQNRNHEIAIKYYKEILKLNKNENFVKLSMAISYHSMGQYRQAKPLYIELLDIYPNSEQIVANLLSVVIQETPYEAIYLLPSFAMRYQDSSLIQAQASVAFAKLNRYDEAIKYLQKAMMIDNENLEYQYNLAVLFDLNKNYSDALRLYRELLKKDPNNNIRNARIKKRLAKIE